MDGSCLGCSTQADLPKPCTLQTDGERIALAPAGEEPVFELAHLALDGTARTAVFEARGQEWTVMFGPGFASPIGYGEDSTVFWLTRQ